MNYSIRQQLAALKEESYQVFAASLIPNINVHHIMGVRLPALRKLAKTIAQEDWRAYLADAKQDYFEEVMLQGMVIGYAKTTIEERLHYVADFVPKINNWSVCDSFCNGLKQTKDHLELVWTFLQPYMSSEEEYELRFGIVMLLNYYIQEPYIEAVFERLDQVPLRDYYVKMAVAWAISIGFIQFPQLTLAYLERCSLDNETYNKALQKITESLRVDAEVKAKIRKLKRK